MTLEEFRDYLKGGPAPPQEEETGGYFIFGEVTPELAAEIADYDKKRIAMINAVEEVGFLSERQFEILELLADGKTNIQVASSLGITENTVKAHLQRMFRALGTPNRAAAVAAFTQWLAQKRAR